MGDDVDRNITTVLIDCQQSLDLFIKILVGPGGSRSFSLGLTLFSSHVSIRVLLIVLVFIINLVSSFEELGQDSSVDRPHLLEILSSHIVVV